MRIGKRWNSTLWPMSSAYKVKLKPAHLEYWYVDVNDICDELLAAEYLLENDQTQACPQGGNRLEIDEIAQLLFMRICGV